ncbi:hypothetical protein Xen7305DRAFT_00037020 [Xenococcus sp. PCC 7305]|uniref:hypothetical protein n=1 Tax=Xenococcus sp. PCC 7305 TaxID=102125 RepID=UPI0002AB9AE7|nr:hypothetical protein [Xenococcus sp. PCC 7305]ELS03975.1 hypothetical protein Xen7305DRAFT_00037020 [Xenococcus sp. PCC 7305]
MNKISVINQNSSQAQKFQSNAKVPNSPFRYNTPYSNLAYEDINNSHRGKGKILPLYCSIKKFNREYIPGKLQSKIVAIDTAIAKR